MDVLKYMQEHGHEQLVACSEPSVGLRAFIAIHDTTLGPAAGGVRIWSYETEDEAVLDALRLSQAMTHKSAATTYPATSSRPAPWEGCSVTAPSRDSSVVSWRVERTTSFLKKKMAGPFTAGGFSTLPITSSTPAASST